jgi:tRNA-splicing ligase RtcB
MAYQLVEGGDCPIKCWTEGVPFEYGAQTQLRLTSQLPIVGPHIAVMPDVHFGIGSTVGSVIPTSHAIIPAAVGVDIGCGMMAVRTSLTSHQISENAQDIFEAISKAVPHGGAKGKETGNWNTIPDEVAEAYRELEPELRRIIGRHGPVSSRNSHSQLGTLGGGNHFIEVCIDEEDRIWLMLHSGSRGVGNKIGSYFIEKAKDDMDRQGLHLPSRDLAYFSEGSPHFDDYVDAVHWAQEYARINRELMMQATVKAVKKAIPVKMTLSDEGVNCHHNYVQKETHFGQELYITRKGAVSARAGELGIIPGSMGTRSYIVRGKGDVDSFCSCSHGAGRVMPRGVAKQSITLAMHRAATEGIVCRKDKDVVDESPAAYKDIDLVMKAQEDLVEVVHTLHQIVCVKG